MLLTTFFTLLFYYTSKILIVFKNPDTVDLILSSFHALMTVLISLGYLSNIFTQETYLNLSTFSMGYAIYDIYFLNFYNKNNMSITLHHLLMIIGVLGINFYKDPFILKMYALNYISEISTPFLNLSLYLFKNKMTDKKLLNLNLFNTSNFLLLMTYLIFRVLLGTYLIYRTAFYNILSNAQIVLTFLNYFWFYKLIKKSKKLN